MHHHIISHRHNTKSVLSYWVSGLIFREGPLWCHTKYSEVDVIKMLEFLTDNMYAKFSGQIFQLTGHKLRPLFADLFLYGYEVEFIQGLLKACKKHLAQKFNYTYRYIDDVLSLNHSKISEFIGLIYPCELEIKDTTEFNTSASISILTMESLLLFQSSHSLSINISSASAYGLYVSQLVHYARACCKYEDGKLLTNIFFLSQGYRKAKLVSTVKKFYGRHHDIADPYNVIVSKLISDLIASVEA